MSGQAQLTMLAFYPLVALNSKGMEIQRLHLECLDSFKLRFFDYPVNNVPVDADKRIWYFFIGNSLPITHPLHPATFRKIMFGRALTLTVLHDMNFNYWMNDTPDYFNALSVKDLLARIFTEEELALAADQVF